MVASALASARESKRGSSTEPSRLRSKSTTPEKTKSGRSAPFLCHGKQNDGLLAGNEMK